MSISVIETVVLLFPNEEWSSTATDTELNSLVAQLRPNISFAQTLTSEDACLETLSTTNADRDGYISGFLYVPDIDKHNKCYDISKAYVPANVTRQANLPPTDFTLIAIAPWINSECTLAYLEAAHYDPARAIIFFQPNNTATDVPASSSSTWDLQDGGAWKAKFQYPVYAVSAGIGNGLLRELSYYSGNMTDVPFGHEISEIPGIDPRDYVRLYTQIDISRSSLLPPLWAYFLIVLGVLIVILALTSASMHLILRARRRSLARRVASGEVNLEAQGIKRLTVPLSAIESLPLFIYISEQETTPPASPALKKDGTHSSVIERRESGEAFSSSFQMSPRQYNEEPVYSQVAVDNGTSDPVSILPHIFLPYSQPTCAICLEDFVSGATEIRELSCGHIFHIECIDTFLGSNSSLCPMCKKSALPLGYCPTEITNAMVRRERNLRKLRSRVTVHDDQDVEATGARKRLENFKSSMRRSIRSMPSTPRRMPPLPLQPQPAFMTGAGPDSHPSSDEDLPLSRSPSRQEIVEQRIRELAAAQTPIRDPDSIINRPRPKWRRTLLEIFPGFS